MRSFFENKRLVLLLAILALGALTFLAISLNSVPFREGQHFIQSGTAGYKITPVQLRTVWETIPIWKQVVFWLLLGLMVVLIGLLLSPKTRWRIFLIFVRVAFTFWALYFLMKKGIFNFNIFGGTQGASPQDPAAAPMPTFVPPQVSPAFSYLISFIFALVWIGVAWVLYRGWKQYVARTSHKPLEEIARIARSSLESVARKADNFLNKRLATCFSLVFIVYLLSE